MLRRTLILAAAALAAAPASAGAARWTAASPHGRRRRRPSRSAAATLTLTARREGRVVVRAALGRATGPVERVRRGRRDEAFTTPAGKRHEHRLDATRLRLRFPRRSLELLVADDGVAFRAPRRAPRRRPLARRRRRAGRGCRG